MNWVRGWLDQGGVVIDSGANIGQFLLYWAGMKGVNIFAFEPLPEAADWLEECLQSYPSWSVTLIRAGLSSSRTMMPIQVAGVQSTTRLDWYRQKHLKCISIDVYPLDDVLQEYGVQKVRLWKLDVEGHEMEALRGAAKALENGQIEAILIEISDEETFSHLQEMGYTLFTTRRGRLQRQTVFASSGNYVSIPSRS